MMAARAVSSANPAEGAADATSTLKIDVSEEDRIKADQIKDEANALFTNRQYEEATEKYTLAISFNPYVAAYHANRAFAYLKEEFYGAAIRDADKAIELDPKYVKGYYRRATANMGLGKLKDAVKDFRTVTKVAPRDADAKQKLAECEKEIKRREFEKAIAVDELHKSAAELVGDIDSMIVEPSYDGPQLSDGGVTKEFIDEALAYMKSMKKIHRKYVYKVLLAAQSILRAEPTIVDIDIPSNAKLTVCGDIHGQFYDLMNIFSKNGLPSPTNMYLFNGDFVDRGSFSLECIFTLLAFKVLYPNAMYLSRGNHETDDMNKVYGFEGEVKAKYSPIMFKVFSELFNAVPLGNVIGGKILVVHGGLFTRDDVTMDEIRKIDRFRQPGNEGLMCELLWSDPQPEVGRSPSKRGVGIQFGPDVTEKFLKLNDLKFIIRSHEVKQEGYSKDHNGKCITIFSAPNYCDSVGNKGAYIHITPDLSMKFNQFEAVPHPPIKPMQYAAGVFNML
ncbi:serine/threonine-protein phosphatase 5-like protein [Cladochytrium replicatum]|nr:serine/threonine-protein phosphatase 5-like protein [Cladochytrium replicatum]